MLFVIIIVTSVFTLFSPAFTQSLSAETLDRLDFGNSQSEKTHFWHTEDGTRTDTGHESVGRRFLVPDPPTWTSGGMFFTLKVRPEGVNYVTFSFRGNAVDENMLILYIGGKQLGYRHLGDYDVVHHGGNPAGGERPYYITTPIPESVTSGRDSLELELRACGRIWGYGENFEQFQKNIEEPSHFVISVFSHTSPFLEEIRAENEKNPLSEASRWEKLPVRTAPGETETLEKIRVRICRELENILKEAQVHPISQQKAEFLAKGYALPWCAASFQNPNIPESVLTAGDEYYRRWTQDETLAWRDPGQYNSDWFGTGPLAEAVLRMNSPEFRNALDGKLSLSDGSALSRRRAWGDLFSAGVQWLIRHRRQFTNQSMIIDWNIYRMNRALRLVDSERALDEKQTLRYLYESVGLEPWRGSETENGPESPFGDGFYRLTPAGLSRELGYVGSYGEVLDWGVLLFLSTCEFSEKGELLPETGDAKIREQLVKMARARSFFRYPASDADGFRAMRLETAVGWRDTALIGPVMYGERTGKEGAASWLPYVTREPAALAAFQQMLSDGQFFPAVSDLLRDGSLRVSHVLIDIPLQYEYLKSELSSLPAPENTPRLPMSPGSSDFLFSDPVNGIIALRHGEKMLYVSLYWRARFAVNYLSKVHYITPYYEHFATVKNRTEFISMEDGTVFQRPNWTCYGFRPDYGVHYPVRFDSLHRGEALPVAKMPEFVKNFELSRDNLYAGRGEYYELAYGPYFFAMNMSSEKTFSCSRMNCRVAPMETRVFRNGKEIKGSLCY